MGLEKLSRAAVAAGYVMANQGEPIEGEQSAEPAPALTREPTVPAALWHSRPFVALPAPATSPASAATAEPTRRWDWTNLWQGKATA